MTSHPLSRITAALLVAAVVAAAPVAAQTFTDQTAIGVAFQHNVDWTDEIQMGAGAAWGDYDGDGDLDLYVGDRGGPNKLFENQGGASFVDVAVALGVDAGASDSAGALWGDYDNDGDQDLYVLNRGDNIMYRNDGSDGGTGWIFTDVTAALGVEGFGRSNTAAWGDYDNDGWLDLYVANHVFDTVKPPPGGLATHADHFYHSVDDGMGGRVFVDIAEDTFGTAVLHETIAHSVAFFDYDNDGDLDIYVVNEFMGTDPSLLGTILWQNDGSDGVGGWNFTDVTVGAGCFLLHHPMGIAVGDYNNDGWWDFSMGDLASTHLFQNNGGTFTDVAAQAGVDRPFVPGETYNQVGWGVVFSDFDLNGIEDLYVATGGLGEFAAPQPNPVFFNDFNPPDCTFTDLTDTAGANDSGAGRGVVRGDYDNDGDEDLYVMNYGGDAVLLRNDQPGGDWVVLDLEGTRSNRDGIGARAAVTTAGLGTQYRLRQSGSSASGSHGPGLHFGLTGETVVDEARIDWPSGGSTTLTDLAINQHHAIRELTLTLPDASLELDEYGRVQNLQNAVGNHLGDFRIYVSLDGGAPTLIGPDDFDVAVPVEITDQRARSRVVSLDDRLRIDFDVQLRAVGANHKARVLVRLTNLSAAPLDVVLYSYSDWNIGGAEGDIAKLTGATRIRNRDWTAVPGENFDSQTNRVFDHFEIDLAPTLLDKLEQAVAPIDLSDGTSPLSGDVSSAVQFAVTIDPAVSWQVAHDFVF